MKASLFYRIAAVLILLFAVGHTVGFLQADPSWGVDSLLASMKSIHFNLQGFNRSYWDFFVGFGLFVTVFLIFAAVLAWQLGGVATETPSFRDSPVPMIVLQSGPLPVKTAVMRKLRERGIYALSDGREFVVHAVFRGGYAFYTPEDWQLFGPYAYESDADGHMRWTGLSSDWRTEDLIDTNRTARTRSRSDS